jgi:hypothetical protein
MTDAIPVYGSEVRWGTDGLAYTKIPECRNVVVPEVTQDYIEVTNLDSPNGFREYIIGLKDGGELGLEINYTAAAYSDAKGYSDNGTLVYFQVKLPLGAGQSSNGDTFEWTALVTPSIQPGANGEHMTFTLNLRVTGEVTYTEGS